MTTVTLRMLAVAAVAAIAAFVGAAVAGSAAVEKMISSVVVELLKVTGGDGTVSVVELVAVVGA